MTQTLTPSSRTIRVAELSRVEGEGGLFIKLGDGTIEEVRLDIFEPPRFFEAFLRGRHLREVPDITARICGICPVAYQMSSALAFESGLGIRIRPEVPALRRLMYWAEYIESHALHIYLLSVPDFLGYESALTLAADHRDVVERGLRLRKIGNQLLEVIGGRASHPVSVCVGGFHKAPRRGDLLARREDLLWAIEAAKATVGLVSGFTFPQFEVDAEFVALLHPREYGLIDGRIVSSRGLDVSVEEYETSFTEHHVAHSTALHSIRADTGSSYVVGPLARMNLERDKLLPQARQASENCGIAWPSRNPFHAIVARAIELLHACEESLAIIDSYVEPDPPTQAYEIIPGRGCGASEAPRGVLYHSYTWGSDGLIQQAKIVPPTAQNLHRMEDDLRLMLPSLLDKPDAEIGARCEQLVRAYDPCISCSTHFLKLRIDR
jgi:coenzyme F420-reducing hydrogenase alpha subunit